jgi:DNA-binding XRE family transcriptional regulator
MMAGPGRPSPRGGRRRRDALVAIFDPSRLTQARQAVSWTEKHLADKLDITAAAVGQYESGVIRPRAEQLERMAQLSDVPPDFFAVGRPRADVDAASCHFRVCGRCAPTNATRPSPTMSNSGSCATPRTRGAAARC